MILKSTWDDWIDTLKARCPPPRRTRVVARLLPPDEVTIDGVPQLGTCHRERQTFYIEVANDMSVTETIFVLSHEWGHMNSWTWRGQHDDHGDHFGIEWARAYAAIHHSR